MFWQESSKNTILLISNSSSYLEREFPNKTKIEIPDWINRAYANVFCNGHHTLFNNVYYPLYYFNRTNGSLNYVINDIHRGMMYRFNKDIKCSTLVIGKTKRIQDNATTFNKYECYKESIHNEICLMKEETKLFIINDDYLIWFSNGKECAYGKLMFVNSYDTNGVQVFFDDNATNQTDFIVDWKMLLLKEVWMWIKYGKICS